jgi:hypothetical protein
MDTQRDGEPPRKLDYFGVVWEWMRGIPTAKDRRRRKGT